MYVAWFHLLNEIALLAVMNNVPLKRSQSAHFSQCDFAHKPTTQRQEHDQQEIYFLAVLLVLTVNLILIHCKQDSIYEFRERKLSSLAPNYQIPAQWIWNVEIKRRSWTASCLFIFYCKHYRLLHTIQGTAMAKSPSSGSIADLELGSASL